MPKVIVVGGVNGRIKDVFSKLASLHAKNDFAFGVVAGDLFADPGTAGPEDQQQLDGLLHNRIDVPFSVYFALGKNPLPPEVIERLESNNGELCSNVYFLGKRTTIKTSDGLRLVALGGVIDKTLTNAASKDKYTPFVSMGDVNTLKGANTADILITHHWPRDIQQGSKIAPSSDSPATDLHSSISELVARLKPRYHFSTSPSFYEREPFFHVPPAEAETKTYATTRFISLASFGNPSKQKWIYAFALEPTASAPLTVPAGTTASPFAFLAQTNAKRALASQGEQFSRFAAANGSADSHARDERRGKRRKHGHATAPPPPDPSTCFFCLSSPTLSAHLVVSIGTEAYLTTARGPLSTNDTFAAFLSASTITIPPLHILIIPMSHTPTLSSILPSASRTETLSEMHRYRRCLNSMLATKAGGKLGSVCWEVSRAGGVHAHWQFLAVDADLVDKGLVEAGMRVEAENQGFVGMRAGRVLSGDNRTMEEVDEEEGGDFFRVWIWRPVFGDGDGDRGEASGGASGDAEMEEETGNGRGRREGEIAKTLVLPLPSADDKRFDLQFGRRVMAKLMGLESRINWKDCGQSEEEETRDADAFKEMFKRFDYTLEE